MKRTLIMMLLLLLGYAGINPGMVHAQQPLHGTPWYVMAYQPETDSLHWINPGGEQASMPRPTLDDEAQHLDMRVSPNGETLVMTAQLNSGLQSLGIYNLATGVFNQTHIAQPGETIHLGDRHIFTEDSQFFAVGLSGGDFANPTWRVILFDTETGDATSFIDHTHPEAPDLPLSAPSVQVLDDVFVHVQMIPQGVGGAVEWPAYTWRAFSYVPEAALIVESPYTRAEMDYRSSDGRVAFTYTDNAYASADPSGPMPNFNAVGWTIPTSDDASVTTVHADSSRYHLAARWALGDTWLLFLSDDASGNRYWSIIEMDGAPGDNGFLPLSPEIEEVYGLIDGYLMVNDSNMLLYSNTFDPNTALPLAQLTAQAEVVYVTPMGIPYTLSAVPGSPAVIPPTPVVITPVAPSTEAPPVIDCSLAPPQRVVIGSGARVVPSVGGLNLRAEPNGSILLTLTGGDTLDVTGGPICSDGLYWWQVNHAGTIGWVAEATSNGYFIEPYDGPPPAPPAPEAPPVQQPQQPPVEEPTFTCEDAPDTRLSVGVQGLFITNQGPRISPNGVAIADRAFMSGTRARVNAGPQCVNGQIWWQVSGIGRNTATGEATAINDGWVAETTTSGQYRMGP